MLVVPSFLSEPFGDTQRSSCLTFGGIGGVTIGTSIASTLDSSYTWKDEDWRELYRYPFASKMGLFQPNIRVSLEMGLAWSSCKKAFGFVT